MDKDFLPFIKNEDLYQITKSVLDIAAEAASDADANLHSNVIDPFSAIFDALRQGISLKEWLNQEKSRQVQKTLQNALGSFHQEILGSMDGWENLGTGQVFDLVNRKKKIIAEVKNKYNTTKGNHKIAIYDDFSVQLNEKYKGFTAYYVEVIPKNRSTYDKEFTPPDNRTGKRRASNKNIRVIDGKSFYALASGHPDALKMFYLALPLVISDILKNDAHLIVGEQLFSDLFDKAF